jgi:hypothetical protein
VARLPQAEGEMVIRTARRRGEPSASKGPTGAEPERRSPFRGRHPDLLPFLLATSLGGAVLGATAFFVGSSRGLDQLGVAAAISLVGTAALLLMLVIGMGRVFLLQEPRLLLAAGAVLVGSTVGDALAFRLVPGDTTDGTAMMELRDAARGEGATPNVLATCRWDRATETVREVVTRRPFSVADAPFPATLELDPGSGTFRLTRYELGTPVARATGTLLIAPDDPSQRAGSATELVTEQVESLAASRPDALADEDALQPVRSIRWACPALP